MLSQTWVVRDTDASVEVPAGRFDHCLQVDRMKHIDGTTKTYWFKRGVGKIKESEVGDHDEELVQWFIP